MALTIQTLPIVKALRGSIRGEVLDDTVSRGIYATDASMYQMWPLVVVVPKDREDVIEAIRLCAEHHLPILPRAGGTSFNWSNGGPSGCGTGCV